MEEFLMSYREVIPDQTSPEKWNDIILNTGGSHSTLQDIKVSEKAGGYCFKDVAKNHNRNRFITWRTYHDTLELSEVSLDLNLINNHCRYKFAESPVLSVAIFESNMCVVILVATVSSLHRLYFPHPDRMFSEKGDMYSIFSDASTATARDPSTYFVLAQNASSNNPIPHTAACELSANGETALFSLAYPTSLMLYEMDCSSGATTSQELKQQNMMPRLLGNITASLRGKSKVSDNGFATSLVFNTIGYETFLYALYRDDHIRMWSTKTNQCVATVNCVREGVEARPQGPQTNSMRRASPTTLCVFLCYATGSEFVTIQTSFDGVSNYMMTRTNLIAASEYDLVDFEINESRIWGLWCNSQVEFNISSISLQPEHGVSWTSAALEPPQDRFTLSGEQAMDPKQAYCSFIFHPGKFQKSVISKALVMFRRSNLAESNLPMSVLKDRVCQAVETEIQNELKDFHVSDEEYIERSTSHWERFYSCCEQYHVKACQPVGLVIMESFGAVAVIKKSEISLLRPCDTLEHLMLAGENADVAHLAGSDIAEDVDVASDLVKLVSVLSVLEEHLSDEVKMNIDKKLYVLETPNLIISKIVSDLLSQTDMDTAFDREFLTQIRQEIQSISALPEAMMTLLEMLRIDKNDRHGMQMQDDVCEDVGNLFGSHYGISVLAESLRQVATIRYSICRHLLILQHILTDTFALPCEILEVIASKCMPMTVVYLQAYNVMVWICEKPATASTAISSLETNIQRLAILKLNDKMHMMSRSSQPVTLLELFLRGKGSQISLTQFAEGPFRNLSDTQWKFTLLPMINIIGQLIWPVSGSFDFGEWLIGSCQHILVQEYVRLLSPWCEWNKCSRQFILAVSHLDNGSPDKAFDLFMQSANGVLSEFLIEKIIQIGDGISHKEAMSQYFLKIIQLFEQYSALDYVIDLAQAAIDGLDKEDPQLAMFQSIIFTNHLALDHYEEAYNSLIYNAEHSRRKDCLRQLVVCLFQEKRLDLLMRFPYVGLQEELESIVESRARSMAIEENDHYNFLYAFHIAKDNFRKAASIMYEKAMRFQTECDTVTSTRSRYECLLACINILHLVDPKYAWIARPAVVDLDESSRIDEDSQNQVIVLEIDDIRKEMLLAEAILLLASKQSLNMILHAGPTELAAVLANNGHFTDAVKLANGFGLSVAPVLDILASFCVRAADEDAGDACAWLHNNSLGDVPRKISQIDMAWSLLQKLINENATKDDSSLYKSVTNKILYLCAFLPQWLVTEYKKINASELLHLYVMHGRLIEASELASEYIYAILGRGFEYFGLKNSLIATMPQTCFPLTTIDHLLYALKQNSKEDVEYGQWYADLDDLVKHYIKTALQTSTNKIDYESKREIPI